MTKREGGRRGKRGKGLLKNTNKAALFWVPPVGLSGCV